MIRSTVLVLSLWLGFTTSVLAVVPTATVNDSNYTIDINTTNVILQSAFTAPHTITLPYAAGTQIGQGGPSIMYQTTLNIFDTVCTLGPVNTLTIAPQPNNTINGSASPLVISAPCARVTLWPLSGSNWYAFTAPLSSAAGGTNGQVQYNNGGSFGGFTTSGDATINTSTGALTLATVNTNTGTWGSATLCSAFTTNGKGLITAAANSACTPALANITGMGTGVATALAIAVGSAGAPILFNGAGGTPSSMVATNLTGTAAGLTAGTASAVAVGGITGLSAGCGTWLAAASSANLRGCVTDETGTGVAVFSTSPNITTPTGIVKGDVGLGNVNNVVQIATVKPQSFAASGTYTPSTGMIYTILECWGAGGGGGGASNSGGTTSFTAGGGGAGSYNRATLTAAAVGASLTVTIGAAGATGANTGGNGGNGGDSCFTTTSCVSGQKVAGKGGTGGTGSTTTGAIAGGAGGIAGTGDITGATGQPGASAFGSSNTGTTLSYQGGGGSSSIGGAAQSTMVAANAAGVAGTGKGSGGSGGVSWAAGGAVLGGAGTIGFCAATDFNSQ